MVVFSIVAQGSADWSLARENHFLKRGDNMNETELLTFIAHDLRALHERSKAADIPEAKFFQALISMAVTSMILSQGREETAQLLRYLSNKFSAANEQVALSEIFGGGD